jgi:hypothetical protein
VAQRLRNQCEFFVAPNRRPYVELLQGLVAELAGAGAPAAAQAG